MSKGEKERASERAREREREGERETKPATALRARATAAVAAVLLSTASFCVPRATDRAADNGYVTARPRARNMRMDVAIFPCPTERNDRASVVPRRTDDFTIARETLLLLRHSLRSIVPSESHTAGTAGTTKQL